MTPSQFVQLVNDMRAAQQEYFRTRTKDALIKSKNLERQVDEWLEGLLIFIKGKKS